MLRKELYNCISSCECVTNESILQLRLIHMDACSKMFLYLLYYNSKVNKLLTGRSIVLLLVIVLVYISRRRSIPILFGIHRRCVGDRDAGALSGVETGAHPSCRSNTSPFI